MNATTPEEFTTQERRLKMALDKRMRLVIDIDLDLKFWALLPAININIHSKSFEFEWLCIGIYVSRIKSNE